MGCGHLSSRLYWEVPGHLPSFSEVASKLWIFPKSVFCLAQASVSLPVKQDGLTTAVFLEALGFLGDTLQNAPWVINKKYNEGP